MIKFETIYKLRILYKSGQSQEFEVKYFTLFHDKVEWEAAGAVRPVKFGCDDVVAVWQIGTRRRIAR